MIVITLALAAVTLADRWVHVGGSPNQHEEYVDKESIQRSGEKVTLWTRRNLVSDQGTIWNELELDCRIKTETILATIQDDGRSISHSAVRPHREASPIRANSVEERLFNLACR